MQTHADMSMARAYARAAVGALPSAQPPPEDTSGPCPCCHVVTCLHSSHRSVDPPYVFSPHALSLSIAPRLHGRERPLALAHLAVDVLDGPNGLLLERGTSVRAVLGNEEGQVLLGR